MTDRTITHRVPAMLDALARDGHIEDRPALERFVLARQEETGLPLHLRVLIGIGAVIASVCLVGFLNVVGLISFDDWTRTLFAGLISMAAAAGLIRLTGAADTVATNFVLQMSLAAMVAGKSLFVIGFFELFDTSWAISLAALLATAATYHVYRQSVDRFLSPLAVLLSVLLNITQGDEPILAREHLIIGFFVFQLAGAAVLLTHGRIGRAYSPLAHAFAFSLCATVLSGAIDGLWVHGATHPVLANGCMTIGLIALFAWAAGGMSEMRGQAMILASLGAVVLGAVSAPGVMLSIGLLILGYARHDRWLLVLGGVLMPAFLWTYYYNLDVSLLTKSLILAGSGAILLAGRTYMACMRVSLAGKSEESR